MPLLLIQEENGKVTLLSPILPDDMDDHFCMALPPELLISSWTLCMFGFFDEKVFMFVFFQ